MSMVIAWIIIGPTIGAMMDGWTPMVMFGLSLGPSRSHVGPSWTIRPRRIEGRLMGEGATPQTKLVFAQLSEDWRSAASRRSSFASVVEG